MTQTKPLTEAQHYALRFFAHGPVAAPRSDVARRMIDAGLVASDTLELTEAGTAALAEADAIAAAPFRIRTGAR